jgi:hypothetical protein
MIGVYQVLNGREGDNSIEIAVRKGEGLIFVEVERHGRQP